MIVSNLNVIKEKINKAAKKRDIDSKDINLIAVSKGIEQGRIKQAIQWGCQIFAENRIAEAQDKWPELRAEYPNIKLHLIGHLQSKKAKEAVKLFDVIETLDSEKLAAILAQEMKRQNKYPDIFVQINIGEEQQKSGINPKDADQFIKMAISDYKLPIIGVMCIPPYGEEPAPYFALLTNIAVNNGLKNISMGMSGDYETAISLGSNHVRIGTAIFGERSWQKN